MSKTKSLIGQDSRICKRPDPKPETSKSLTPQELQYLFAYFCTRNHAAAARMVGLRGKNKSRAGKRMLDKILRKCSLLDVMDHLGLDNISLLKAVFLGLEANFVKIATHKGQILDERVYPDWKTRYFYLRFLSELKGLLIDPASELPAGISGVCWIDSGPPLNEGDGFDLDGLDLPQGVSREDVGLSGPGFHVTDNPRE